MSEFDLVYVSHHQMLVLTTDDYGGLPLYTIGDDLVHLTGESALTVMTGPHSAPVAVRAVLLSAPPQDQAEGWDAASEATLWSPDGHMSVCGLMGDCPGALQRLAVGGPGLVRVQVRARNRQPEDFGDDETRSGPREEYEVLAWPVRDDVGPRTLFTDDLPGSEWNSDPGKAAEWAMVRLVTRANPDPRRAALRRAAEPARDSVRVDIRRDHAVPVAPSIGALADLLGATVDGDELVLPAGELNIGVRLSGPTAGSADGLDLEWRWIQGLDSTRAPDPHSSSVELRWYPPTLVHRGVRGEDAILLGLVWDYLLHRAEAVASGAAATAHPWQPVFTDIAAKAAERAAAERLARERREAREWGGWPPSDRLRTLPANVWGMAQLDRRLLDALADALPDQQRAVARWAAHQACTVAGLAAVDWIARGLTALDHDAPLPPPFDDDIQAWNRLFADPQVPQTTVTLPNGPSNFSQQAAAFPAIVAALHDDPLAAAVDALHAAAGAHGNAYRDLLTAARIAFPVLSRYDQRQP